MKSILKDIRDQAFLALKKDFIGDLKQLETLKEKLSLELRINSKAAVKEIAQRLDEQLTDTITKRIERDLESRVRRGAPSDTDL